MRDVAHRFIRLLIQLYLSPYHRPLPFCMMTYIMIP